MGQCESNRYGVYRNLIGYFSYQVVAGMYHYLILTSFDISSDIYMYRLKMEKVATRSRFQMSTVSTDGLMQHSRTQDT
jgi:hypothetical protein